MVTNGGVQLEAAGSQAHCQCAHHRVFMLCGGFLFWRLSFSLSLQVAYWYPGSLPGRLLSREGLPVQFCTGPTLVA
eukprot:scaffold295394_cov35-Attheya_sp.AAC.1